MKFETINIEDNINVEVIENLQINEVLQDFLISLEKIEEYYFSTLQRDEIKNDEKPFVKELYANLRDIIRRKTHFQNNPYGKLHLDSERSKHFQQIDYRKIDIFRLFFAKSYINSEYFEPDLFIHKSQGDIEQINQLLVVEVKTNPKTSKKDLFKDLFKVNYYVESQLKYQNSVMLFVNFEFNKLIKIINEYVLSFNFLANESNRNKIYFIIKESFEQIPKIFTLNSILETLKNKYIPESFNNELINPYLEKLTEFLLVDDYWNGHLNFNDYIHEHFKIEYSNSNSNNYYSKLMPSDKELVINILNPLPHTFQYSYLTKHGQKFLTDFFLDIVIPNRSRISANQLLFYSSLKYENIDDFNEKIIDNTPTIDFIKNYNNHYDSFYRHTLLIDENSEKDYFPSFIKQFINSSKSEVLRLGFLRLILMFNYREKTHEYFTSTPNEILNIFNNCDLSKEFKLKVFVETFNLIRHHENRVDIVQNNKNTLIQIFKTFIFEVIKSFPIIVLRKIVKSYELKSILGYFEEQEIASELIIRLEDCNSYDDFEYIFNLLSLENGFKGNTHFASKLLLDEGIGIEYRLKVYNLILNCYNYKDIFAAFFGDNLFNSLKYLTDKIIQELSLSIVESIVQASFLKKILSYFYNFDFITDLIFQKLNNNINSVDFNYLFDLLPNSKLSDLSKIRDLLKIHNKEEKNLLKIIDFLYIRHKENDRMNLICEIISEKKELLNSLKNKHKKVIIEYGEKNGHVFSKEQLF